MVAFFTALWFVRTALSLLQSTYYWQLKEYRWDRMQDFLARQGGLRRFFGPVQVLLLLVFLMAAVDALLQITDRFWLFPACSVLFLTELILHAQALLSRKFRRPKPTLKALLIYLSSLGSLLLVAGGFALYQDPVNAFPSLVFFLLLLVVLDHDTNAFWVMVINALTGRVKKATYKKALAKRAEQKKLKVIGITGSYGKTSVKEYLAHVLRQRFKVLATEKNTNTEMGIAHTILHQLKDEHEVFVCEMGAYGPGEVGLCCAMAQPQIGIFTGLNEQHLSLFGDLDTTFVAKNELMQSLPRDGLMVYNLDSDPLKERLVPADCPTALASTKGAESLIHDLKVEAHELSFAYKGQHFAAALAGAHNAVNLLMVILVAEHLGMPLEHIAEAFKTLKAPQKTLEVEKVRDGIILDDSYNVNPDGLRAALKHLQLFKNHRKVLIFPGILELGKRSDDLHRQLGQDIAKHVDSCFITSSQFYPLLWEGAQKADVPQEAFQLCKTPEELKEALSQLLKDTQEPVVFLFESRGAEKAQEWLRSR